MRRQLIIIIALPLIVSELVDGGELFDRIGKFSHKLIQLYVAEIAVALGKNNINLEQ